MIRVLFESSIFLHQKVGGISKYITTLDKYLSNYNVSSKIFSPITVNYYLDNKKKNIYYFKFKRIPRFCRKIFFFINNFLTAFYIVIKKPDILHLSYYNNALIKFLNIPYIITVYDLTHEKINSPQREFKKKNLLDKAFHIICISEQTKKDLKRFYNIHEKKITVIYLGSEKKKFKVKKHKEKFILHVGSRDKYKNFQSLVEAFSQSKYLKNNFKLVCFGGGDFKKEEFKLFEKLGVGNRIRNIKGNDFELEKFYKKANLFVSLSEHEGFGLTLLEAMKFGCPVVCSDIPVFREVYNNSCIYVKPKSINDIKKNIENILKSKVKQKKIILNSKKIVNKFSWEKCALDTSKVYQKILAYEK